MPQKPRAFTKVVLELARDTVAQFLADHQLHHLKVTSRGQHVVVYSEEAAEEKVSRIRFTLLRNDQYQLGIADHRGKWEQTPYEGSLTTLLTQVSTDFPWALTDF